LTIILTNDIVVITGNVRASVGSSELMSAESEMDVTSDKALLITGYFLTSFSLVAQLIYAGITLKLFRHTVSLNPSHAIRTAQSLINGVLAALIISSNGSSIASSSPSLSDHLSVLILAHWQQKSSSFH
jgi:hypothetical protein